MMNEEKLIKFQKFNRFQKIVSQIQSSKEVENKEVKKILEDLRSENDEKV